MSFDIEDYNKWARKTRRAGGEPCLRSYLETKIKTIAAQEAVSKRWNREQSQRIPLVDIATQ